MEKSTIGNMTKEDAKFLAWLQNEKNRILAENNEQGKADYTEIENVLHNYFEIKGLNW